MTRLDQNRAQTQLAQRAGVPVSRRHQRDDLGQPLRHAVPDFANANIGGRPVTEVVADAIGCGPFIELIAERPARRSSKPVGCRRRHRLTNAAIDSVNSLHAAPAAGRWASARVVSRGEYGTPEGLQYGFPVVADGAGGWSVAEGLGHGSSAGQARHHDRRADAEPRRSRRWA